MGSQLSIIHDDRTLKVTGHSDGLTSEPPSTPISGQQSLDPRSPNIPRTPMNMLGSRNSPKITKVQDLTSIDQISSQRGPAENNILKNRLLRDLGYANLNDPRSPSQQINRTPISLKVPQYSDDSIGEENFVSFSEESWNEISDIPNDDGEYNEQESNMLPQSSKNSYLETHFDLTELELSLNSKIDPRSPSMGVERTPIVLKEIATTSPSIASEILTSNEIEQIENNVEPAVIDELITNSVEPNNAQKLNLIYEDDEVPVAAAAAPTVYSTPKQKSIKNNGSQINNRTPLGCLANTPQSRLNTMNSTSDSLVFNKQQHSTQKQLSKNLPSKYLKNMLDPLPTTPKNQMITRQQAAMLGNKSSQSYIPVFKNSNRLK